MGSADNKGDLCYECIAACVDDLLIASKSPQLILDALNNKHNFTVKGTGHISYHLSCDFTRDGNNELCLTHHKCFYKMSDSHMSIFGSKPSSCCHSPLEKADHLEIDTAKFLNADVIRQRQSLIGVIQ